MDADLITQCADDSLEPAIVERFIKTIGAESPLAITVTADGKAVLIPAPRTSAQVVDAIRRHVGKAIVRVGLTQYPAGVGVEDTSAINERLVDPCENIRLGTALFAKIYRIVTHWYGGFMPEAFDDAVEAYRSGYFEGEYVFAKGDPGNVEPPEPEAPVAEGGGDEPAPTSKSEPDGDPYKAGTRIDLDRIRPNDVRRSTDVIRD